jgi:hypothetical protein
MGFWVPAALWCILSLAIGAINAFRYRVRILWVYWPGEIVFTVGGVQAAHYHSVPAAFNVWLAIATAGWLGIGVGLFGIPPRKPTLRSPKSPLP